MCVGNLFTLAQIEMEKLQSFAISQVTFASFELDEMFNAQDMIIFFLFLLFSVMQMLTLTNIG